MRKLCSRDGKQAKDTRTTVANVEKEREAWKRHFEKVSEEEGKVSEKVWASVPSRNAEDWMGQVPEDDELEEAFRKMKVGRAGGEASGEEKGGGWRGAEREGKWVAGVEIIQRGYTPLYINKQGGIIRIIRNRPHAYTFRF